MGNCWKRNSAFDYRFDFSILTFLKSKQVVRIRSSRRILLIGSNLEKMTHVTLSVPETSAILQFRSPEFEQISHFNLLSHVKLIQ